MRISSSQFYENGLQAINSQQSRLMHVYQQLSSGGRMVTAADDPLAAAQAINISQAQSLNERFSANREVARRNLGAEENTLWSVTLLLQDIKTRLIEAGNGALSDQDRATLADVLRQARTSLLGLANATDGNGQFLFSGSLADVVPFQATDEGIAYMGDGFARRIQADHTRRLCCSDTGLDVFARAAPGTTAFLTRALATNTGTGVIGRPSISAATNTDIHHYTITFTSSDQFEIAVTGSNGEQVDVLEGLTYVPGQKSPISLPSGVQVFLWGNPQPDDVFIVEAATGEDTDLNVFSTLDGLIDVMQQNTAVDPAAAARLENMLGTAMQRLDINYDNVLTVRAAVGARLNELDALDANGSQRALGYGQQLSRLEDLDYYHASMQLQLRLSALEAASFAFQKIQATGLLNLNAR